MVCPTCFCTTVSDGVSLDGKSAERVRRWDSCFTIPFSHMHGGSVRVSLRSRYRQWITHKLATWADQFGSLGCVGCGRCVTWCPVGIDITEEVAAILQTRRADRGIHERGEDPIMIERRLAEHPFLSGIDAALLAELVPLAQESTFVPGTSLLREGDDARSFDLIEQGRVSLEVHVPGKR
ncbi:4Fe-4S dicluster domain-containing protein [Pendulispora brunnea]|uniref:4Fe-4S dicluster domain-containing protein n=1 Tax=Pendulispora brunnea TaxID=2905690 RepID=A0ABZ2K4N4_9BACT